MGGAGTPRKEPSGPAIIIVPNAMSSPITLINAMEFFDQSTFTHADVLKKKGVRRSAGTSFKFKRSPARKYCGAPGAGTPQVEYEIIDTTRKFSRRDWDRVVAVVPSGQSWQFKGWAWSDPVELFNKVFGYYVGMEGTPIPAELQGWKVKVGNVNRDKRGLDCVTYSAFWNGLDQWMSLNKPEFFPRNM